MFNQLNIMHPLKGNFIRRSVRHCIKVNHPIGLRFFGLVDDLQTLLGRRVDLVSEGILLPFATQTANRAKTLIYERTV